MDSTPTTPEYDLVITNGVCVTASDVGAWDLAIKDEKIVLQAPSGSLSNARAKRIIDAEGGHVMVGASVTINSLLILELTQS